MSDTPSSFRRKPESSRDSEPDPLRADAEARLADHPPGPVPPSAEELLHELQVHQIELEMQNEALRQSQIALEESRDRYLDLYEFAPVGYLSLNPGGQITTCNLTCATLLGVERTRLVGRRFANLAAPAERVLWHERLHALTRQTERQSWEMTLIHAGGAHILVRMDGLSLPGVEIRLSLTDISQKTRTEQELAEQERLLRAIAENSPDAIFVLDRDHRMRYFNPVAVAVARKLRGQPDLQLGDLQGLDVLGILGDSTLSRRFMALDEQVMASGQPLTAEEAMGPTDAQRISLTIRTPLRDSTGRVTGLVGIARDISERKRAEAQRLEAMERQRNTLVQDVHHRIKNSLQSVAGLLQRELGRFLERDPRLQAAITQVRAIAIVHGLQGATPAENIRFCDTAAQICLNVEAQTLHPVAWRIEDAATAFKPVYLHRDEAVAVALIVNELVLNAVKHSASEGGPVQVSLFADGRRARLHIRNRAAGKLDFDLTSGRGLNTGLRLVQALLPGQGVQLNYAEEGDGVLLTELVLDGPVVLPLAPGEGSGRGENSGSR